MTKRSSWKLPFLSKDSPTRQSTILPSIVGHSVRVHNGKQWVKLAVDQNLVGQKLGELVWTRARYLFKKTKGKK